MPPTGWRALSSSVGIVAMTPATGAIPTTGALALSTTRQPTTQHPRSAQRDGSSRSSSSRRSWSVVPCCSGQHAWSTVINDRAIGAMTAVTSTTSATRSRTPPSWRSARTSANPIFLAQIRGGAVSSADGVRLTPGARGRHGCSVTRSARSRCRRLGRTLLHGVVALAVLVPAVIGGLPYVWCGPMAEAQLTCCCPSEGAHGENVRPTSITRECCVGRRVSGLDLASVRTQMAPAIDPPLVAIVPAIDELLAGLEAAAVANPARPAEDRARAGPSPPLFELHRAYLI